MTFNRYKPFIILTVISMCFIFTGCKRHYVYTETIMTRNLDQPEKPYIVSSPEYSAVAKKTKNVAIKAPDACYGQAASASVKHANSSKDIVRSKCGVEMSIVERSLTENGYNVFSWEMLESMARAEEKSHLECARQLGAEVLFTINSLEEIVASDNSEYLQRSYYQSDESGTKEEPRILGEKHRQTIRSILQPYEEMLYASSLGASIDVTAIEVSTGKSIWFYKKSEYNLENQNDQLRVAFIGRKNSWKIFKLNDEPISINKASNIEYDRKKSRNADVFFQEYIQRAVSGFISSFKSGGQ